jgi:Tfp pilus assembly protein PilW
MFRIQRNSQEGFTLVELLLYVGISSIMVVTISSFITLMLAARVKNRTIAEVEQQGIQVMELITQTIRNAESVTAPSAGTSDTALTLDVRDAADDPTVFHMGSESLVIDEGVALTHTVLTNDRVIVSDLTFTNLSGSSTPGTIRVEFTITYSSPDSSRNEFTYAQTFKGSAILH